MVESKEIIEEFESDESYFFDGMLERVKKHQSQKCMNSCKTALPLLLFGDPPKDYFNNSRSFANWHKDKDGAFY